MTNHIPHTSLPATPKRSVARLTLLALTWLTAVATMWPATAAAAPAYPDLRSLGPTTLSLDPIDFGQGIRYVLSFQVFTYNQGEGAFELQLLPNSPTTGDLSQRVYDSSLGFHNESVGTAPTALNATSYEVPRVARYEVWTARDFSRAQAKDFTRGQPLHSLVDNHCFFDGNHIDESRGPANSFYSCGRITSGVSVGWAHSEFPSFDEGLDVGPNPLPDGDYVLRAIADPENRFFESPGKADPARESEVANSSHSQFRVINGHIAGTT